MAIEFSSKSSKRTHKETFIVNGKEVSIDEVPEKFRELFKDEDRDGTPDIMEEIFEGGPISAVKGLVKVVKASKNLPTSMNMKQQKSYQPTSGVETPGVWRKLAIFILLAALAYLAVSFLK